MSMIERTIEHQSGP